ncbi:hypothetical protein V6N13_073541 [Hibiscus sabdariffa]|uniref:Uncharacterized protein n=2 Tax=Hibiscus sabdariffa TaxID=183260 RepID=A0ABR1ZFP8_9ROSI
MGNCMKKPFRSVQPVEEEIGEAAEKESQGKKGSIKVKIVLTKEELHLFLLKLNNNGGNGGGYRLEQLLAELEKERSVKAGCCWRPSLDSIMEEDDAITS